MAHFIRIEPQRGVLRAFVNAHGHAAAFDVENKSTYHETGKLVLTNTRESRTYQVREWLSALTCRATLVLCTKEGLPCQPSATSSAH